MVRISRRFTLDKVCRDNPLLQCSVCLHCSFIKTSSGPFEATSRKPIKVFQAKESCRHLGFWATPNGDMTSTKERVFAKTREVLGLLTHHPLETKTAKELFQSMAVSVFRFSAASALEPSRT
jgi:hypothetical protein